MMLDLVGEIIGKLVDMVDVVFIFYCFFGKIYRVLIGVVFDYMGWIEYVLLISEVCFCMLDEEEICYYVLSGELMDKVGVYGIQGCGGMFVEYLVGSFFGVMGLLVCEIGQLLKGFGWCF